MASNKSSSGLGVIIAVVLALGALTLINKRKSTTQVPVAQINLIEIESNATLYSPTLANIRKDIQKLQDSGMVELKVSVGELPSPVLGQTKVIISEDSKIVCTILLDVKDAIKSGDRVEPLLGHELKHVWDILYLYDKDPYASAVKFIQTVNNQTKVLYHDREVETSAIGIENVIRRELKASKNKIFDTMPRSREDADLLYLERSKADPSLRKVL